LIISRSFSSRTSHPRELERIVFSSFDCLSTFADLDYPELDFTSDLTVISKANSDAISKTLLYSAIAPLFSLLITAVFVKELGALLGGEFGLKTLAAI